MPSIGKTHSEAQKLRERRRKSAGRRRVAESIKGLGSTLLALQDRRRAIEMEEEKMKREREFLDLRIAEEERLKGTEARLQSAEERQRLAMEIGAGLRAAELEETKKEHGAGQKRHDERMAARKETTAVSERVVDRYRQDVLGDFNTSLGRSIFNQIIREVPGDPAQAGYAKSFREKAQEFLLGSIDEELSEEHGRVIRKPGVLEDIKGTDRMVLFEETLDWIVKNAKNFNWNVGPRVADEILGREMKLVEPTMPMAQKMVTPQGQPTQAPKRAGVLPGDEFDRILLGE